MFNQKIAKIFHEIALYLEMQGVALLCQNLEKTKQFTIFLICPPYSRGQIKGRE